MELFIGSSRESESLLREVEFYLQDAGHSPLPWDRVGLFPPGESTFETLIAISRRVDGAVFIFSEDDKVWYRGDSVVQPRDNVLIEYGLFTGSLGPKKAIICIDGTPKRGTDLLGINVIELGAQRRARGRMELKIWADHLNSNPIDPALLKLKAKVAELIEEKERISDKLIFESDKSKELQRILRLKKVIDFDAIDLAADGYWKLLFSFKFYSLLIERLSELFETPVHFREALIESKASAIAEVIAWQLQPGERHSDDRNPSRIPVYVGKALRVFREYSGRDAFPQFVELSPRPVKNVISITADEVLGGATN